MKSPHCKIKLFSKGHGQTMEVCSLLPAYVVKRYISYMRGRLTILNVFLHMKTVHVFEDVNLNFFSYITIICNMKQVEVKFWVVWWIKVVVIDTEHERHAMKVLVKPRNSSG